MKNKLEEIHSLRAFGVIGVVLLHSMATNVGYFVQLNDIVRSFLGYVIPVFIFISGFVLSIVKPPFFGPSLKLVF